MDDEVQGPFSTGEGDRGLGLVSVLLLPSYTSSRSDLYGPVRRYPFVRLRSF